MARGSRLRRDLPVDIDVDAIWGIAESIGATQKTISRGIFQGIKADSGHITEKGNGRSERWPGPQKH
ncbi:Uncharacterised protein [Citrobacter koseri]|nr:Uncharacterised protein [Citrobacter koseri]